jgi:hypothetical protein
MLRLEEKAIAEGFQLTEQQVRIFEKANPEFALRHVDLWSASTEPYWTSFSVSLSERSVTNRWKPCRKT